MDIFEIKDSFEPLSPAEEKAALRHYLKDGNEARAARVLKRVGMLDRETGKHCLIAALERCSAEIFQKLLDHVPRGEYAGDWMVQSPRTPPIRWRVAGTLPTLAAAMDKSEHLRLLLDWGCDVNSASLDAATALKNGGHAPLGDLSEFLYTSAGPMAPPRSGAWWRDPVNEISVRAMTPLAAAILLGSVSCVRLLLEREDVWLTETPSVSEALALVNALPSAGEHQTCRRLLLTRPDGSPRPLLLWAAIRRMNAASLREELRRCAYGADEACRAALTLADGEALSVTERTAMLAVIDERFPGVLRGGDMAQRLAALAYFYLEGRDGTLPEFMERALGDTVELDESVFRKANYSTRLTKRYLKRLGKNRKLVMSRDDICEYWSVRAGYLRALLRYVEFRAPSLPLGVSALTEAILQSGDTEMLRSALERGLIPAEEPLERLLELAGKNTAARSLLLTYPRPSVPCAAAEAERFSCRVLTEDEEKRVLTDPALRAMASDALLLQLVNSDRRRPEEPLCAEGFDTVDYAALCALRGETDIVLRCALHRFGGVERPNVVLVNRTGISGDAMFMTLLCCAAAAGQTETVRALLDAGFDPEERDMGRPSALWSGDEQMEILTLSPLLCALLWGRWDTAALLLERGAWCDLTDYTARRAFEEVRGGEVPYGEIRRELGTYLEGRRLGTICALRSSR